jgi:hypothetical protein
MTGDKQEEEHQDVSRTPCKSKRANVGHSYKEGKEGREVDVLIRFQ